MYKDLIHYDQKFLQRLVDEKFITVNELNVAYREYQISQKSVDRIIVDLGYICPIVAQQQKSFITNIPYIDVREQMIPQELSFLDAVELQRWVAFPFLYAQSVIHMAMHDPLDLKIIDEMQRLITEKLNYRIEIIPYHTDYNHILARIANSAPTPLVNTDKNPLHILNHIFQKAIEEEASDIHFQPSSTDIHVCMRLDGILQTICVLHHTQWSQILNRLKVLAKLDIIESQKPQSGHFMQMIQGHDIDIRVSTHPTLFGENIVLRLLDQSKRIKSLNELGFSADISEELHNLAKAPQGLIVITGPTGSGKTTTLYALLLAIYALLLAMDHKKRNIMTLEAPVEAILPHIRQTQIQENSLLSYAEGIRSLLRQDPDVILIGEIRDEQTAQMAMRAVLTGHLVLSTMHTQDALGVVSRLLDLNIAPSLISETLHIVIAQRLIRILCQHCGGSGCDACIEGYKGRKAIVEKIVYDEEMKALIAHGGHRFEFEALRRKRKISTLWEHGLYYVEKNLTTHSELKRVLGDSFTPQNFEI